jgi:hypothetical protein
MAQLVWHNFGVDDNPPWKKNFDGSTVEIVQREVDGSAFKEDNLILSIYRQGAAKRSIWFASSYGTGAIAMKGHWIFLRYGIGRGTFAREEHIKIYRVDSDDYLEEMADVKISSYVENPDSVSGDPILAEYKIKVSEEGMAMTITFIPPAVAGIKMPEKIVKINP